MAANGNRPVMILVVEDDTSVRRLAHLVLETNGYAVLEASGCSEACRLSEEYSGPIDLLLTDIVMPNKCGVELAMQLSQSRPTIKVLFMSGHSDETLGRYWVNDDHAPMLRKPFTIDMLNERVRETLAA